MDQIVDRVTVGIPTDVEVARADVSALRRAAETSASLAALSAAAAEASAALASERASAASAAAAESRGWADARNLLVRAQPDEPRAPYDGMLWLVTDEGRGIITAIRRWDSTAAGSATFPAAALWPSASTWPRGTGAWASLALASALSA